MEGLISIESNLDRSLKRTFLLELYREQEKKKWNSSSTSLQLKHIRLSGGIEGFAYLPVSIAKLCALIRNFEKLRLTYVGNCNR